VSFKSFKSVMAAKSSLAGKRDIDYVLETGSFICGSPETVRRKIAERYRDAGFGNYIALLHFGTLPHALTLKSTELFASRVMPYLRENLAPSAMETA
jgi:alkanesulfonate monooxygenase SsuD/methylene tetrahydromethanopterin reductase-like flavin-dependent oxidoreductase (luciferase family)